MSPITEPCCEFGDINVARMETFIANQISTEHLNSATPLSPLQLNSLPVFTQSLDIPLTTAAQAKVFVPLRQSERASAVFQRSADVSLVKTFPQTAVLTDYVALELASNNVPAFQQHLAHSSYVAHNYCSAISNMVIPYCNSTLMRYSVDVRAPRIRKCEFVAHDVIIKQPPRIYLPPIIPATIDLFGIPAPTPQDGYHSEVSTDYEQEEDEDNDQNARAHKSVSFDNHFTVTPAVTTDADILIEFKNNEYMDEEHLDVDDSRKERANHLSHQIYNASASGATQSVHTDRVEGVFVEVLPEMCASSLQRIIDPSGVATGTNSILC